MSLLYDDGTHDPSAACSRLLNWLQLQNWNPTEEGLAIDISLKHGLGIKTTVDCQMDTSPYKPTITVPNSILITPHVARECAIGKGLIRLDELESMKDAQLLVLFLLIQLRLGDKSSWYPYMACLPSSYTCLEWWTDDELKLIEWPRFDDVKKLQKGQQEEILSGWKTLCLAMKAVRPHLIDCSHVQDRGVNKHELPLHYTSRLLTNIHSNCLFSLSEFQWAYSTVATRSCYLPPRTNQSSNRLNRPEDKTVLVPFLDMFNHSSQVQTNCTYDTNNFQLFVYSNSRPYLSDISNTIISNTELSISYGALDTFTLLQRYGFVLDNNRDDFCTFSLIDLEGFILGKFGHEHVVLSNNSSEIQSCLCGNLPIIETNTSNADQCIICAAMRSVEEITSDQVNLMRGCGLQDCANECDLLLNSSGSINPSSQFRFENCNIPWRILSYCKIRCLLKPVESLPTATVTILKTSKNNTVTATAIKKLSLQRPVVKRNSKRETSLKLASKYDNSLINTLINETDWIDTEHLVRTYSLIRAFACHLVQFRFKTSYKNDLELLHSILLTSAEKLSASYRISSKLLLLSIVTHCNSQIIK